VPVERKPACRQQRLRVAQIAVRVHLLEAASRVGQHRSREEPAADRDRKQGEAPRCHLGILLATFRRDRASNFHRLTSVLGSNQLFAFRGEGALLWFCHARSRCPDDASAPALYVRG